MKSFTKFMAETVDVSDSPDVRRFIAKHNAHIEVVDHPVATDAQTGNKRRPQKDRSRKADNMPGEDKMSYEGYRVVMKTKDGETFRSGVYDTKKEADGMHWKAAKGNKYKSVEIVKEEVQSNLFEVNLQSRMTLNDGSNVRVSDSDMTALKSLFDELSGSNKSKMEQKMMEDKASYAEILRFAKEAM